MKNKAKYGLEQVAIRMVREPPLYSETPVICAEDAVRLLAGALRDYDREVFGVVNFKTSGQPINMNIASMGTLNHSLVNSKEILKSAILSNANSILLFHNHPGGRLYPSKEDIRMTDKLILACELMDVSVLDHIILGGGNTREYFSFKEKEVLAIPEILYKGNIDELEFGRKDKGEREVEYVEKGYRKRGSVKGKLGVNRGRVGGEEKRNNAKRVVGKEDRGLG